MKALTRIVVVAVLAGIVYFVTIGNNQFYQVLDTIAEVFQTIGNSYLRK